MSSLREDLATTTQGVVSLDKDGRVLQADRVACAILARPEADLRGTRLGDLLPLSEPGEVRFERPDGSVVWLVVETQPVGRPDRALVHLRDVTAARLTAHAERDVSSRAAIEGSWILDACGRTVAVSPSTAALLGYTPEEMRDRPPADFIASDDAVALRDALRRREAGVRESYEVRWRHRDGTAVWALMSAAPIRDAEGRFAGSFALVTDVSDRHREDERLARHARQQEAVARLGRRALEGADLASLFDDAARETADVLGVEWGGVFLREADVLRLAAVHGLPAGAARDMELTSADALPGAEVLDRAEPVVVRDWERERTMARPEYAVQLGVRSSTAVPITGRRGHGLLTAARSTPWAPEADELRFLQAVANVLAAAIDRSAAEEAGRTRAMHDVLTGLPNRTLALDRLTQALRRAAADGTPLAVIAIDLDRFKRVNDEFGVEAGDEVVRAVGAHLRALVRSPDTVARLSGDSLLVICEELPDDASAAGLAGRIVEELRAPIHVCRTQVALTVSVGVAIAGAEDEAGDLVRDAEAAVERAKAHGRDRFELFDPALRAAAADRVGLERDLRGAAERGELVVAHQPIVAIGGGQVTGTEALVRWRHPERGVVPPGDFIDIAEESGLIVEVGAWVLRQACSDVAARHRAGRPITCHVNLSPRQVADPDLRDRVAAVLAETGLPPEHLVLELTESSVMEAGDGPLCTMQRLRELGVRIVLDDFGTGYSSLARLRSFPVDGLKIDRSFVNDLDGADPSAALIVAGIVELARALGLTVVAEGVETATQLARLRRIGCRYAQGFMLARPGDTDALDLLLARASILPEAA